MNTTMADGAAQRLVAQIAADLFGQPGLTLMELAEKVKEARNNDVPLGYVRVEAIKALREDDEVTGVMVHVEERADSVPVYLSAQPSPGGQGDARAIIEEFIQCATLGRPHGKLIAQAKDYLAARQPEGATVKDSLTVAARQPVGQPVAFIAQCELDFLRSGQTYNWLPTVWARPTGQAGVPLYAAPPAQAVDLGQFLPAVRMLVVSARTSGGTAGRDAHLCEALDRVEALLPKVDSQAVGNGTDR